jgi:hypothetical protein
VNYFQSPAKDIQIERTFGGNSERGGIIEWNPTNSLSDIPNNDGTSGRNPFIGLAHEMGHTWNRWENGNTDPTWYPAADGTQVPRSEIVATWWENRIRSENNVGLREFYSFTNTNGRMQGESAGRLLIQGSTHSQHLNIFGSPRVQSLHYPIGPILNIPFSY